MLVTFVSGSQAGLEAVQRFIKGLLLSPHEDQLPLAAGMCGMAMSASAESLSAVPQVAELRAWSYVLMAHPNRRKSS